MKPRTVAKATAAAGWGGGMTGILAGWPVPAALAVPAFAVIAALAVLRRGRPVRGVLTGLKAAVQLRRSLKTIGTTVDRA